MNTTLNIALVCTGLLVGILLTAHFKSGVPAVSSYPFEQYESHQELVKSYLDEQALLKSRIAVLREDLDAQQSTNQSINSIQEIKYLQDLKRELGLTDLDGAGVTIELDDSKRAKRQSGQIDDGGLVHAADLRDIINVLYSVGVEAVAVNDQRVVLTTSINGVGSTILVNNTNMLPPFTITAIGQPEALLSRLTSEKALPDFYRRVREDSLLLKLEARPYIHLPFYTGSFNSEFIQVVE